MRKKKIMIVDDEEDFLKITKLNLEDAGDYEVATLASAKDIITRLHDFKPDLLLLDLLIPGMDGMKVCEILSKDPLGQKVPVVILSALDKDTDKLRAYKMGIVDYIVKPIEKDELIAKLQKIFSNAKRT